MKRLLQCALACAVMLSLVAMAAAQPPTPVTRMGDWVEIGDDTFMNIIGNIDIRYSTSNEYDFESDIQEQMNNRAMNSSGNFIGEGDFMEAEIRFGADFRYKKKLRTRILFETQQIFDGNLIDDRQNNVNPSNANHGQGPNEIGAPRDEDGSPHVERFWIDYKFTPFLRMRVGADLWTTDAAGWIGDDDPRFAVFVTPTPTMELMAAAVIQSESARLGITNDNDDVYYTFGGQNKFGPHTFGLHNAYFRWRFDNIQRADTFLHMPHATGTIAGAIPIEYLAQVGIAHGKVDDMRDGTGGDDYNVLAFGAAASIRLSLVGGMVRPFLHVFYASPDTDADDDDLHGFATLPQREITLMGVKNIYSDLSGDSTFGDWGPAAGARASIGGGNLGSSTTGNPFRDRLGNGNTPWDSGAHPGQNTAYSNAGSLVIPVGLSVYPIPGNRFTLYYTYVGFLDDATLKADNANLASGGSGGSRSFDKTLYHQISAIWQWTLNSHFDIRLVGAMYVPGDGTKDMAKTVDCKPNRPGLQGCDGDDIALRGVARFRARF